MAVFTKRPKKYIILTSGAQPTTAPTTGASGAPISDGFREGSYRPLRWVVEVHSADRSTSSVITGGGTIWGYDGNSWLALGTLNDGGDLTVAAQGYAEVVNFLGFYERVAFSSSGVTENIDVIVTALVEHDVQ